MLSAPSSQSITVKLILFYLLLIIDIIISSFIEASFNLNAQSDLQTATTFIPLQLVVLLMIIVMIVILMWQTFLLRYGLLNILISQFFYSFLIIIIVMGLSLAERLIRLIYIINNNNPNFQLGIWNYTAYQVFYYLRFISYPLFYGVLIDLSLRLANPDYYRANKWLK